MVSYDVVSFFTKIPTGLAVEIAKSRLEAVDNLEKSLLGLWRIFAKAFNFA